MSKAKSRTKPSIAEVEARNRQLAAEVARICDDRRGENVLALDMRRVCGYADFFVIASATSQPQIRGMTNAIEKHMRDRGARRLHRAGVQAGSWVVLDYGDVVVHLFDIEHREFYQLEELWGDAARLNWEKIVPARMGQPTTDDDE